MKGNKKFIVMIAMVVLALLVAACAFADEKLYTSDPYKIPHSRVEGADQVGQETPEGEPAGTETPGEVTEQPGETGEQPGEVPEEGQTGETPEGGDVTPEEMPAEPEAPKEPLPPEERKVYITSSRTDEVTDGDAVYLEAHLVGFDGLTVNYQWQCDKNDGNGWQNVGTNRNYHVFIATRETVQYSWRLIVDVVE